MGKVKRKGGKKGELTIPIDHSFSSTFLLILLDFASLSLPQVNLTRLTRIILSKKTSLTEHINNYSHTVERFRRSHRLHTLHFRLDGRPVRLPLDLRAGLLQRQYSGGAKHR